MIRFVLIDVHGVITRGDERRRFTKEMERTIGVNSNEHNEFWERNLNDLDIGAKRTSDYIGEFNERFDQRITPVEYFRAFLKEIVVNQCLLDELDKTKARLVIASDNMIGIAKGLPKVFGRSFNGYRKFYSYDIHKTKVKGMLKDVLKSLKAKPEECVLIDDSPKNISVAESMGMSAILHKSNARTMRSLKKLL